MKDAYFRITLDVKEIQSQATLPVKLHDTNCRIYISLTEGGLPYPIEEGDFATFTAKKSDGSIVVNNCIIENGKVRYDFSEGAVSTKGVAACEIRLYNTTHNGVLCSPRFTIIVDDRVVDDSTVVLSDDELGILDDMVVAEQTRQENELGRTRTFNSWKTTFNDIWSPGFEKAKTDAETAINNANTALQNATEVVENAAEHIVFAYDAATAANTQAGLAETASGNANNAATNANAAAAEARVAADNIEEKIDEKFNIVAEKTGRNVLDKTKFEPGWLIEDGTVEVYSDFVTSDYIPVTEGLAYALRYWKEDTAEVKVSRPRKVCFYDENKVFRSGTYMDGSSLPHEGTLHGASYIRISFGGALVDTIMLLLGDTSTDGITGYIPYSVTNVYGLSEKVDISDKVVDKQDVLVSGENVKTINGESILGSGNVEVSSFELYEEQQNRNMLDSTTFESGWLVEGGTIASNSSYATSDYIPVTEGLAYKLCYWNSTKISYVRPRKVCLYDENKQYIANSYVEGSSLPYEGTFTGASYVRVSIGASQTSIAMLLLGDTNTDKITEYIPYGITRYYKIPNNVVLRPKFKVVAAGDSITYGSKQAGDGYADMTEGVSYMTMACEHLGFELENHSISASTLSLASDGTNPHQAFIERYAGMSDDADLVYIAMGTNDWYYYFDLGEMSDRTKTTFYGALHLLCKGLKEKYPSIPIVFATPIKRWIIREGDNALAGNLNIKEKDLNLWRNAIKEVCEYHSIPVVDMYAECFLNAWEESERTNYMPDGTHPNGAGHKKMQITCEAVLNKYLGDYYI